MERFIEICEKDIREIYSIISPCLPDFEIEHLNQSVIYEPNKKVLSRSIKNDKKEMVGHEIAIYTYDTKEVIKLLKRQNSVKLEKRYYKDNAFVKEKLRISLNKNIIKRCFSYSRNDFYNDFQETYDISNIENYYEYLSSSSIESIFTDLKQKNKTRKID